jgi:hypothetical protein
LSGDDNWRLRLDQGPRGFGNILGIGSAYGAFDRRKLELAFVNLFRGYISRNLDEHGSGAAHFQKAEGPSHDVAGMTSQANFFSPLGNRRVGLR